MTPSELTEQRDRIIAEDGPWTAHWFELAPGVETRPGKYSTWDKNRAMQALRLAQLALGKRAHEIRALDLGCLEGGIAIHLALAGCEVVGLEIRESSLRKARFVAAALGMANIAFMQGDMLQLPTLGLGKFDLIVCAGTLYHVDAPDLLPFVTSLNDACRGITVFDTLVSASPSETFQLESGLSLLGESIVEHSPHEVANRDQKLWASLENNHSFVPTERSLANLLLAGGFVQVMKPLAPVPEWIWRNRDYWVGYSAEHARSLGLASGYAIPLSDPDERGLNPTLLEPLHKKHPNPATQRIPTAGLDGRDPG